MKFLGPALLGALLLTSQARAQDPALSLEARKMLAYGTLAVAIGACKADVTPEQNNKIRTGMANAAQAQTQFSEGEITEMMKAVGAQIGANKDQVCASLTPDFIDNGIEAAAAGD